jgi:hypothetical protein
MASSLLWLMYLQGGVGRVCIHRKQGQGTPEAVVRAEIVKSVKRLTKQTHAAVCGKDMRQAGGQVPHTRMLQEGARPSSNFEAQTTAWS